jgi:hypothetical protein
MAQGAADEAAKMIIGMFVVILVIGICIGSCITVAYNKGCRLQNPITRVVK